jgi:hypothetical protein
MQVTCSSVHQVKLKRWSSKQDQWLPKPAFMSMLPALLAHKSAHDGYDPATVYGS